jgi:hypothetical protein
MATYLPFSDVVAAYGYRQPASARQRGNLMMLALAYVVIGAALGAVAGTGLALASFHTAIPIGVFQIAPPVQASSIQGGSAVESLVATPAQSSELTKPAISAPAGRVTSAPHKAAKVRLAVTAVSSHAQHQAGQIALPTDSARVLAAYNVPAEAPASSAAVETSATDAKFYSEGDVTVADFDASSGRIETYEGRTFAVGTAAGASAAAVLQDSGSNVHYRCDQGGTCTLTQAGMVMHNVRLL